MRSGDGNGDDDWVVERGAYRLRDNKGRVGCNTVQCILWRLSYCLIFVVAGFLSMPGLGVCGPSMKRVSWQREAAFDIHDSYSIVNRILISLNRLENPPL